MKKLISVVLALVLVSVLSVSAFAAVSPVTPVEKEYTGGTITIATPNPSNPLHMTFEAVAKDGYKFVGWEIEGAYEEYIKNIDKINLNSNPITITLKDGTVIDDVVLVPKFEKIKGQNDKPVDEKPEDESPKTGDSMAMLALAVVALGGAVVSKKRLSK